MLEIDNALLDGLLEKAAASERRRMNFDLRTCATCPEAGLPVDGSQRMLNALLPGTCVPVHRHPRSPEYIKGLAAVRGSQWGLSYAESFEVALRAF